MPLQSLPLPVWRNQCGFGPAWRQPAPSPSYPFCLADQLRSQNQTSYFHNPDEKAFETVQTSGQGSPRGSLKGGRSTDEIALHPE
jgi:hypothetical protein